MPPKLNLGQIRKNISKFGHVLISDEYVNSKTRIKVTCGFCKNEMNQTYDSLMRGYGHGCRGTGLEKMNSKNRKKRLITLNRFICLECSNIFYKQRKDGIFCDKKCMGLYYAKSDKYKEYGEKGGMLSNSNNRSLNEIYFANLCSDKWGIDKVKTNEKIFDGFDADIILPTLRIAIEWNGIFHYKKVKKGQRLKQKQARDKVKKSIITKKYGWGLYIIKDLGSHNKKFVKQQFDIFCNSVNNIIDNLPGKYISIIFK